MIAGAGPAGLLLAAELAAAGLLVTVLADGTDQAAARSATDLAVVQARTLEHLDALDVADAVIDTGEAAARVSVRGIVIDLSRLPSRFPFALFTSRQQIDQVLARHAAALGAHIVGVGPIESVTQRADGIEVLAGGPGGTTRTFTARYLVGADIAGNAVSAALGRQPDFLTGRVILAGGAARGPGLDTDVNEGLQDAANLGWKLSTVLRGGADPGLLETYQDERGQATRQRERISRLFELPFRQSTLLTAVLSAVTARATNGGPAADLAARALSGLSYRYHRDRRSHRLAGRRTPDAAIRGRHARLYVALRERHPILMVADESAIGSEVPPLLALWPGRLAVTATEAAPAVLTLVRPDSYIAWATDSGSPARRYAELRQALGRYCGPPAIAPEPEAWLR